MLNFVNAVDAMPPARIRDAPMALSVHDASSVRDWPNCLIGESSLRG